MSDSQFDCALDLLRRLSPRDTKRNLDYITALTPELTEDLLASVDKPLELRRCAASGRDYLLCDYNRDRDSYRSPWSNEFDPPLDDEGTMPSEPLRKLEVAMNQAFDVYRGLYFEGGVSSVYLWDLDDGFAGVVLMKKEITPASKHSGVWDSIHVFEALDQGGTFKYKLTTSILLHMATDSKTLGDMDLSGNMTRQHEETKPFKAADAEVSHLANIGTMVEAMETQMRNLMREVYFDKTRSIVADLRSVESLSQAKQDQATHRDVISAMRG